jgi:hypothetical protein
VSLRARILEFTARIPANPTKTLGVNAPISSGHRSYEARSAVGIEQQHTRAGIFGATCRHHSACAVKSPAWL